jgi:hypothetical protein
MVKSGSVSRLHYLFMKETGILFFFNVNYKLKTWRLLHFILACLFVAMPMVPRIKAHSFIAVPDHDGGRPKQINAWFLYTHMVYL